MDGINLHLPPVIPDSYYDISTHNTAYHTYQNAPNTGWPNREDNSRVYQSPNTDFDSQLRFHGNSSVRRGCQLDSGDGVNSVNDDAHSTTPVEQDWAEEDDKDVGDTINEKTSPRQSQVALTLQWLNENYERAEGVCLPRCVLYQHYLDFCKKMKFTPAGAATFGKIIRQRFPKLTTRRLGTRGQSKYHYYGIGIKETSIYYHSVYSGKGLTRFSGIKLKTEGSSRKYSLSSKTGTLLPEFPNAKNFILPPGTDIEKMKTFIMMYRTHCQRILDTIISANFEEVQNFLVHFWQGMPEHLLDLLNCDILSDIIALCDSILYKTMTSGQVGHSGFPARVSNTFYLLKLIRVGRSPAFRNYDRSALVLVDVLIPSSIQELPKSLYGEMRMFAKRLPFWLETSMETVPSHIQEKKLQVAKSFIQSLKRQSSFVHLAQTARSVVTNQDMVTQMIKDISNVDFVDICSQAGFLDPSSNPKFCMKMQNFYNEFSDLLGKQSPIEGYTEWIDDIVDKCAIKPSNDDTELFKDKAAEFLLHWGAFGGLLMRELTLQNSSSFASIHLVHLMLDEYAFLVIETQQEAETEKTLQKAVQKYMKTAEEIQTKAVVRNSSNKGMQSPKCKKKRTIDEVEQGETQMHNGDIRIGPNDMNSMVTESVHNGTAFSRPLPNNKECHLPENIDHESHRSQNNALSINSVKPYQPYNNSFDRPTYLPQFGLSPYPEYAPFSNGRLTNYSDSYTQSFPSPHLGSNISPVGSNYWTDGRTHHTFSDPYPSYNYNYNKLNATYDSLNKTTLLRNNAYQESISRQAFESPISGRSYYRGAHDNLQVGPQLQVGAYGTNFMDIAPPGGQYCYQDELFPATMATTFGKPFLSGPFR